MSEVDHPLFLIGSERSGTTLLRLMLDHHPEIAFNLESEFLVTRVSSTGELPNARDYANWLRYDRVFKHSQFVIDENLTYVDLVRDFLRQKQTRDGKRLVGATVHHQFNKLALLWPKARYIYLYRDGRDVANSVVQMGWAGNPFVAAKWWEEAEREWEAFGPQLAANQWIEVRYEDVISQPHQELERICAFIGVDFSERMFDYTQQSTYGLPDASLAYQWRRKLKGRQLQLIEARIGKRLEARGYELGSYPSVTVGPFTKLALHLHSRLTTLRGRLAKFGLWLVVQDICARRLGLHGWVRSARHQIDAIIDADIR